MFYSRGLLSSKGPLGAIWVAAYCSKRLKKQQVTQTDIPSSVDKILLEEMSSVTYRILAYFLLGVVKIYHKKVEYLFDDCHDIVSKMNRYFVKKIIPLKEAKQTEFSITLPERYELDAFILDVADDATGGNAAQLEDIFINADVQQNDGITKYSLDKDLYEEFSEQLEACLIAEASPQASSEQLQLQSFNSPQAPDVIFAEQEFCSSVHTPPEGVFSPHQMEADMVPPQDLRKLEESMEKHQGIRFSREECLDFEMFCRNEVEHFDLFRPSDKVPNNDIRHQEIIEKLLSENHDHAAAEVEASIVDTNSYHRVLDAKGSSPDLLVIRTPANKEKVQRSIKRKCINDEIVVLSNEALKQSIDDSSRLVCKRRKSPHTVIDLWRFYRISSLSKHFLDPLIPCIAPEFSGLFNKKKSKQVESVEIPEPPSKPEEIVTPLFEEVVSPSTPTDSRAVIAPGTPVLCPAYVRAFGSPRGVDSDREAPGPSFENLRKAYIDEEDHDLNLMDEACPNERSSNEPYAWSERTRTVARYLHKICMKRKQHRVGTAVNLLLIMDGKTKKESARLFYETLVLKSGGYVDVIQEKPFNGIFVQETPKLEASMDNCP